MQTMQDLHAAIPAHVIRIGDLEQKVQIVVELAT